MFGCYIEIALFDVKWKVIKKTPKQWLMALQQIILTLNDKRNILWNKVCISIFIYKAFSDNKNILDWN